MVSKASDLVSGRDPDAARQRFSSQLFEMNEMGFANEEENFRVLLLCDGNLDMAVEMLVSSRDRGEGDGGREPS